VAVWGLTYKSGTDTLRRSTAVELCDWLIQQGANVHVHDPAVKDLPSHWSGKVQRCDDPMSTVHGTQLLVIATEWPLYREISLDQLAECSDHLTVLDMNRFLLNVVTERGVSYVAVGTPNEVE